MRFALVLLALVACAKGSDLAGSSAKSGTGSSSTVATTASGSGSGTTSGGASTAGVGTDATITAATPSADISGAFLTCSVDESVADGALAGQSTIACGSLDAARKVRVKASAVKTLAMVFDDADAPIPETLTPAPDTSRWEVYVRIPTKRLAHLKACNLTTADGAAKAVGLEDADAPPPRTKFVSFPLDEVSVTCAMIKRGEQQLQPESWCRRYACQAPRGMATGRAASCDDSSGKSVLQCLCADDAAPSVAREVEVPIDALTNLTTDNKIDFCHKIAGGDFGGYFFMATHCAYFACGGGNFAPPRAAYGWPVECNPSNGTFTCGCAAGIRGKDFLVDHLDLAELKGVDAQAPQACEYVVRGRDSAAAHHACKAHCDGLGFNFGYMSSCSDSAPPFAECSCSIPKT